MTRRIASLVLALILVCSALLCLPACGEENTDGSLVAKVTTKKGSLKLRKAAGPRGRVIGEIPNGTCILAIREEDEV